MKHFSALFTVLACLAALAAPKEASALSWDWVPKVMKFENPYRGHDVTRYPGFECKMRNAWGDCVVYSYVQANRPDNHPRGGKPKNYYRRVTSYGNSSLNWSDCQYDDYKRQTAPRTRFTVCDYGEPKTFKTRSVRD